MRLFSPFTSYVFRDTVRSKTLLALILTVLAAVSAAILLTMGVLEGFRTMLVDGERGWLSDVIISPREGETSIQLSSQIEKRLASLSEVEAFAVRSNSQLVVRFEEKKMVPFRTMGISSTEEKQSTWLAEKIIEGEFFSENHSTGEILLGKSLADGLVGIEGDEKFVHVGDTVSILSGDGTYRPMRVRGVLDAKNFAPNAVLFLQKNELENIDSEGKNAQIVVKLKPDANAVAVRTTLQNEFPTAIVRTWQEESQYVEDLIQAISFITVSIRNLLVATVFLVISIIIYIDVNQKRRQIGILKAMGAPNGFVILAYVFQAFLYALVGTSIGTVLFLLAGFWSSQHPIPLLIGDFQIVRTVNIFVQTVSAVFLSALIGALSPALLAARAKIIDDMRGNT